MRPLFQRLRARLSGIRGVQAAVTARMRRKPAVLQATNLRGKAQTNALLQNRAKFFAWLENAKRQNRAVSWLQEHFLTGRYTRNNPVLQIIKPCYQYLRPEAIYGKNLGFHRVTASGKTSAVNVFIDRRFLKEEFGHLEGVSREANLPRIGHVIVNFIFTSGNEIKERKVLEHEEEHAAFKERRPILTEKSEANAADVLFQEFLNHARELGEHKDVKLFERQMNFNIARLAEGTFPNDAARQSAMRKQLAAQLSAAEKTYVEARRKGLTHQRIFELATEAEFAEFPHALQSRIRKAA